MKKNLKLILGVFLFSIFLSGCGVKNAQDVVSKLDKDINRANSYYAEGTMEIVNNENTYTYNVKVSYQKKDYYKIDLVNTLNNHEQVILRNDEGVYVVTPSLNKSFKFQSDWPYNNSQVYLINSIIEDLQEDEDRVFKMKGDSYYFTSSVNYPNNKSLVKQNVYVGKNMKINKVEVTDKDGKVQITMNFDKIVYNKKFADNYFDLSKLIKVRNDLDDNSSVKESTTNNTSTTTTTTTTTDSTSTTSTTSDTTNTTNNNMTTTDTTNNSSNTNSNSNNTVTNENNSSNDSNNREAASISDVVYPMYLPDNTTLANKEVINTDNGERLILTFSGDNPFVLVEETLGYSDEGLIIPVSGEMDFLNDVIGVINDNSVTFESNGIGYYIVSDKLESTELVNIARSISVLPVSK